MADSLSATFRYTLRASHAPFRMQCQRQRRRVELGKFDEAAAIFLILFAAIVAVDQLSSVVRNHLAPGGH